MDSKESYITVRWWSVMLLIVTIFISVLGTYAYTVRGLNDTVISHETRITRVEEACKTIGEIKAIVKDIRNDQIRRYELELQSTRERR